MPPLLKPSLFHGAHLRQRSKSEVSSKQKLMKNLVTLQGNKCWVFEIPGWSGSSVFSQLPPELSKSRILTGAAQMNCMGGEKASSGTGRSGRAAAAGLSHMLLGSPQQLAPAFSCISFGLELQKKKKKVQEWLLERHPRKQIIRA